MVRVLFVIVAVVAALLAVLVEEPVLFVAAGLALLVSVALMIQRMRKRRSGHAQAAAPYAPAATKTSDDDLGALGILEIKPRQKDAPRETEVEDVSENGKSAEAEVKSDPVDQRTTAAVPTTFAIKEKSQTVRAAVDEDTAAQHRDVLIPYLQALRAAVHAQTVCLLKQADDDVHHHIEAIVSLNAYARSGGDFWTKTPLVQTRDSGAEVMIRRVSNEDFPPGGVGYYRESIAVKEIAVAAVPRFSGDERFVLLADSMQEGGLDTDRRRTLVSHFARVLGTILDTSEGSEFHDAYDYDRPRREIITEEMETSREKKRPLALALVHLNEAEAVADGGERHVVAAERDLATRLRRTARRARVERFGEITFGVFFHENGADVEKWALEFQRGLANETGVLKGGVSIGIAILQDRHEDADAFRRDATDALREAYESGACTIVE